MFYRARCDLRGDRVTVSAGLLDKYLASDRYDVHSFSLMQSDAREYSTFGRSRIRTREKTYCPSGTTSVVVGYHLMQIPRYTTLCSWIALKTSGVSSIWDGISLVHWRKPLVWTFRRTCTLSRCLSGELRLKIGM